MTLKSFKLVIILSSASICRALVNCGYYNDDTYNADTCASCLEGTPRRALKQENGARWCDGDCTWDGSTGQCKRLLQPVESVSCGDHIADTCADCPQGNGAAFCNGECIWDGSTGQCKPQSAECGSIGSNANSCAACPLESSCSSTDCSWHPHTSLCRDAFSDEVRTASVYLNYDRPSGVFEPAWWFQRVIPTASADVTYFSTNGHRFGFGGIEKRSETLGSVVFGLYDQGGCDQDLDPNCNAENIPETVACGTGVNCAGFAFEGTSPGRKSNLDLDLAAGDGDFPQVGQEYYFITQASYLGNRRMEYTGYFYLNGEWRLISRIQVSTNSNEDWSINGLSSSVAQWANIDTTRDRGALFGPSFMAPVDGSSWEQVPSATFTHGTLENHERVNAWQAEADQDFAVGIATGGDTARNASNYCTFDYPPMTKMYDSLGSFSKKVPCLNDATTQSEIEACLISTSSPSPSQYPTISPSQYPTISTPPAHLPTEPPTHSPTEPPTHSPTVPTKSLIPSMSSSKSSSQSPTVPKKKPLPISETPPVSSQSLSIATIAIIVSAAIFSLCLGIFCFFQRRYIMGFVRSLIIRLRNRDNDILEDDQTDGVVSNGLIRAFKQVVSDEQNSASKEIAIAEQIIDSKAVDVFLTHNWGQDVMGRDNHERVGLINTALKKEGITTWFDEEKMNGDIVAQMTNGIDNAKIVIVFITGEYIKKVGGKGRNGANDNCKIEFDYSMRRKNVDNIIAVVMEDACKDTNQWLGAVGAFMGGRLYHNFCHNSMLDSCITKLKEDIYRIVKEVGIDAGGV